MPAESPKTVRPHGGVLQRNPKPAERLLSQASARHGAHRTRVVITTAPGEEGQVDYGDVGPMVRDRSTGKYRPARLFVLTPGCSRKPVRLLAWRSSAQIWAELHERAFRRLGGTVRVIVLDYLKEGVLARTSTTPR